MTLSEVECRVEAILFSCGESVEVSRIAQALELGEEIVRDAAGRLKREYEDEGRGFRVIFLEDCIQMVSAPEFHGDIQKVVEKRSRSGLSPSALEVLSIVAYNQPITKFAIEQVRGADSGYVLSKLLSSGLIEEGGRLQTPGRPILYRTTEEFLRCFSLSSLDELPELEGFSRGEEPAESEESDG